MAIRTPPSWLQAGSHPAENDRNYTKAVVNSEGVRTAADFAVTSLGGMNLSVAGGYGFINGTVTTAQGMYGVYNDAPVTLTVATAHPTLPRIDRVSVVVSDSAYGSIADNVVISISSGTAAASPVAPAIPPNAISLATIAVAAATTSLNSGNITDTRKRYLGLDGVGAFTNEAARTLGIPTPTTGLVTYVGDTGTETPASTIPQLEMYNGSTWQTPYGLTLLTNVTASAAASVIIDNVFSATYDHYRLIWTQDATLANGAAYVLWRNPSGDVITAKYAYERIYAFGTTVGADSIADNTIGFLGSLDGSGPTNVKRVLTVDIHNPFIATASTSAMAYAGTGQTVINITHSNYNQAQSFTGLKLSMQSSNTTGNIKIYGYRNA